MKLLNQNSFVPRIIGKRWWRFQYRAQFGIFHVEFRYAWNKTYRGFDREFNLLSIGIGPRGFVLSIGSVGSTH